MSKLQILADQFADLVKFASSKGKIETALYKINSENITARTGLSSIDVGVSFVSDISLSGDHYTYNGEEMLLPIKDNKMLYDVLVGFGNSEVEVSLENNYVIIENQNSRAELSISSPEMIRNNIAKDLSEKIKHDDTIVIGADILKKVFKNMSKLDSQFIFVKVENGMLYLTTGQENLDKVTEKIEVDVPDMLVKFNKTLGYAIENLDGEVRLGLADNYPMKLSMENSFIVIDYYIVNCD